MALVNTVLKDGQFDHLSATSYHEILAGTVAVTSATQSGGPGSDVDGITLAPLRGAFTISDVSISNVFLSTAFFNPGQVATIYTINFRVKLPHNMGLSPSVVLGFESANDAMSDGANYLVNTTNFVVDQVTPGSFLVRVHITILGVALSVVNTTMFNLLTPPGANSARINFVLKTENSLAV